MSGQAVFNYESNEREYVQFLPDQTGVRLLQGWRHEGVAQMLSDGTFDFIARPRLRARSTLLRKLAHGRLSATRDGAIQLTLKIFKSEGLPLRETFLREALEATEILRTE